MKEPRIVESAPSGDLRMKSIFETLKGKRDEQKQLDHEEEQNLDESVENWPKQMRQLLVDHRALLLEGGFDEQKIPEALLIRKREIEAMYLEKKFRIPNKDYMRLEGSKVIDKLFADEEPNPENANNIGIINIDLNGLKCVNDLSASHENGDKYLGIVVDIFQNGETTKMLKEMGIETFFGRQNDAGDEFALLLSGKVNLNEETDYLDKNGEKIQLIEWITKQYQDEVYKKRKNDFSKLIEFFNEDGTPNAEVMKRTKGIDIPNGFEFMGSISAGCTTLADILLEANSSSESNLADQNYYALLSKFFGSMLDQSDKLSNEDKIRFKKELAESPDINERTLALILARTMESVELKKENEELKARIAELEALLAQK